MAYKIKYTMSIERGDFEKLEGKGENVGMCDAFIFASILKQGGGFSAIIAGKDGTQPLGSDGVQDVDIFKVWAMIAAGLKESPRLNDAQRRVMGEAHATISKSVAEMSEDASFRGDIDPGLIN